MTDYKAIAIELADLLQETADTYVDLPWTMMIWDTLFDLPREIRREMDPPVEDEIPDEDDTWPVNDERMLRRLHVVVDDGPREDEQIQESPC